MTPENYCRDRAAPPGSSLYYATLYHSVAERRRLYALFALCAEIENTVLESHDPGVVRLKLEWWRNELARTGPEPRQHPVSAELAALAGTPDCGEMAARLDRFISAWLAHRDGPPPADYEAWIDAMERGYGQFWLQAAAACGVADTDLLPAVGRSGALLGAFEELRGLAPGLAGGRCVIPAADMNRHGLSAEQLAADATGSARDAMLAALLGRLRRDLDAQDLTLRRGPLRRLLVCRTLVRMASTLCGELQRDPGSLLRRRTALTPVRKLWIAWRTRF